MDCQARHLCEKLITLCLWKDNIFSYIGLKSFFSVWKIQNMIITMYVKYQCYNYKLDIHSTYIYIAKYCNLHRLHLGLFRLFTAVFLWVLFFRLYSQCDRCHDRLQRNNIHHMHAVLKHQLKNGILGLR